MEFDTDYPDDLPELEEISDSKDFITLIDHVYEQIEMTEYRIQEYNLEKKLIGHLLKISDLYDGVLDFSIAGNVVMEFSSVGLKPNNKYTFQFHSGMLQCNNHLNRHQSTSNFNILESDINKHTIEDMIVDFILGITMKQTTELKQLSVDKLAEFSNPF